MPKFKWHASVSGPDNQIGHGGGRVEGPEGYTEENARTDVEEHVRKQVPEDHDVRIRIVPARED